MGPALGRDRGPDPGPDPGLAGARAGPAKTNRVRPCVLALGCVRAMKSTGSIMKYHELLDFVVIVGEPLRSELVRHRKIRMRPGPTCPARPGHPAPTGRATTQSEINFDVLSNCLG